MKFFKTLFADIKTTAVKTVVESKLNKIESQLKDGEELLNFIFSKVFGLYSSTCHKLVAGTTKIVSDNKGNLTDLISENYDTINKIVQLAKSLDTQRNRELVKAIAKSTVNTLKDINSEMEKEFETMEENITEKCKAFDEIWEIKSTKKIIEE